MTPEEIGEALVSAFVAGFMASGEGWNGEWPYGDKAQDPTFDLLDHFAAWRTKFEATR